LKKEEKLWTMKNSKNVLLQFGVNIGFFFKGFKKRQDALVDLPSNMLFRFGRMITEKKKGVICQLFTKRKIG